MRYIQIVTKKDARDRRQITKPEKANDLSDLN